MEIGLPLRAFCAAYYSMVSLTCLKIRGLRRSRFWSGYYTGSVEKRKRRGPHLRAASSRGRFCLALAACSFSSALAFGAAISVTADHQAGSRDPEGGGYSEGREASGTV